MKTTIIFSAFILLISHTQAQTGSNSFLQKIPAIPVNTCTTNTETQKQFEEKISAIIRDLDAQTRTLKDQQKPDEAKTKAQAEQMMLQQGLTAEELEKLKSKKMTKEEKQAMAEKMMQQNANMSMAEANNMKNMSKEGKQAYAEAYATEAQATAQANAKNNKTQPANTNSSTELVLQRNVLYQNIKTQQNDVIGKYKQVDQDAGGLKMLERMKSLRASMSKLVGGGGEGGWKTEDKKAYDAALAELNQVKKDYCQYMTPLYTEALKYHLSNLKSSYNDYQQLDVMTGKIDNSLINTGTTPKAGDIEYLEWTKTYLNKLKEVFKYKPIEEY